MTEIQVEPDSGEKVKPELTLRKKTKVPTPRKGSVT
jgi:hypothetical protein